MRLPVPVLQLSSSENSVGLASPRSVCTSSRLRCVAGGRSISSLARCTRSDRTWASARPWVCSAKASSALAAAWARGSSWALKPCRLATPSCSHSLRRPSAPSNCQPGRFVTGKRARITAAGCCSRLTRTSAGISRASQAGSSASAHSARPISPWVSDSQASPCRLPWTLTASSTASCLSASNSVSVIVPGVTTRTTLRSTGPLPAPTSPTCSAIATASPSLISLAR
mmetsp:Transcript_20934/g.80629  ORF Transcript_20934/g.80629 Transcript_20934/m.80629 type:complete len:227 (+) Transcript_20934:313-993(+)